MVRSSSPLATLTCLLGSAVAFPTAALMEAADAHAYQKPGPTDSRAPCPGLNTLANHGYLPRDGRNITRDDLITGFEEGFGFDSSTIQTPLFNCFQVCKFVEGADCGNVLPNLTILAEPHLFEHDMSLSRQDYRMASGGANNHENNANFNMTIFQKSLDVVGDNTHMDYSLMQEVRLTREAQSIQDDVPGWFIESRAGQLGEMGFLFGVAADFRAPGYPENPKVRVDWWKYWFVNESFPTPLGWVKQPRNISFVLSVSAAVQTASISSTPSPLPSTAFATGPSPGLSITVSPATILPLPTDAPYAAPGHVVRRDDVRQKRAPEAAPVVAKRQQSAPTTTAAIGPIQTWPNPYFDSIDADMFSTMAAHYQAMVSSKASQHAARALATPTPA